MRTVQNHGAESHLLSILGSYNDTLTINEVIEQLDICNDIIEKNYVWELKQWTPKD